eukprot:scaffold108244_cov22-Tisochrysis_lutea.AAC.2
MPHQSVLRLLPEIPPAASTRLQASISLPSTAILACQVLQASAPYLVLQRQGLQAQTPEIKAQFACSSQAATVCKRWEGANGSMTA